jgi:hypothetical protein
MANARPAADDDGETQVLRDALSSFVVVPEFVSDEVAEKYRLKFMIRS